MTYQWVTWDEVPQVEIERVLELCHADRRLTQVWLRPVLDAQMQPSVDVLTGPDPDDSRVRHYVCNVTWIYTLR